MADFPVVIPRLGEAVIEATLTKWLKNEGDTVEAEEPIAEIATDKVDTEIVAPVSGILKKKIAKEGEVVPVGHVIAEMQASGDESSTAPVSEEPKPPKQAPEAATAPPVAEETIVPSDDQPSGTRFYSPLVRSIAKQENISFTELDSIAGTGSGDRITKQDVLNYLGSKKSPASAPAPRSFTPGAGDTVIEMDRIRQLISAHMVKSMQTSPHVTSFIEVDMTRIMTWREKNKDLYKKRHGDKLTVTPIVIEAIAKAVRDFPMVNVSVDGTKIIRHERINIGMAVALPTENLIVPVIRNAGELNLAGVIRSVNDLAGRARQNKLVPDEITGGTISLTNLGSVGTLMGTPIINQPQTAIVAVGIIKKRPVVVETPEGDTIAIRQMMIASVTYDHRVIDGALGGKFLARLGEHLENFDIQQAI